MAADWFSGVYILACLVGLWRLWGFEEKINKTEISVLELVSPKNVIDSLRATFMKRPGHKNIYILAMILIIFIMDMASQGDWIVEMMFLKRIFRWGVDEFSYFDTFCKAVYNVGSVISLPIFHFLNRNDNEIILISVVSCILQKLCKALVRTEAKYYAATALGNEPIRDEQLRVTSQSQASWPMCTMRQSESRSQGACPQRSLAR